MSTRQSILLRPKKHPGKQNFESTEVQYATEQFKLAKKQHDQSRIEKETLESIHRLNKEKERQQLLSAQEALKTREQQKKMERMKERTTAHTWISPEDPQLLRAQFRRQQLLEAQQYNLQMMLAKREKESTSREKIVKEESQLIREDHFFGRFGASLR